MRCQQLYYLSLLHLTGFFLLGGGGCPPLVENLLNPPLHLERFHVVDSPPQPNFYSATPKVKSPTN